MTLDSAVGSSTVVPHVIKGRVDINATKDFGAFRCPEINLDDLVWLRQQPGPAFDTPIRDIIDFLVEVGGGVGLRQERVHAGGTGALAGVQHP